MCRGVLKQPPLFIGILQIFCFTSLPDKSEGAVLSRQSKQDEHTAHRWPADVQTEYPSKEDSTTPLNLFQMASTDSQDCQESNNTLAGETGLSIPLHDNLTGNHNIYLQLS